MSLVGKNATQTQRTTSEPASKRHSHKRLGVSKSGTLGPLWTYHYVNTWNSTGDPDFLSQFYQIPGSLRSCTTALLRQFCRSLPTKLAASVLARTWNTGSMTIQSVWGWVIPITCSGENEDIILGILRGLWFCLVEHVSKLSGRKGVPTLQLWVLGGRIWRHPQSLHRFLFHGVLGLLGVHAEDAWKN